MAGKAGPRVMRRGGTAGPDAREQPLRSRCSYYESNGYESNRNRYTRENPARGAAPLARVAPPIPRQLRSSAARASSAALPGAVSWAHPGSCM